ncbi:MAG: prephenate dehydrogenase/arogenate dehydrogenase family protein [Acidimicrobiales bacterium]|nr:prephenate dehydrogenase/arogenate dehydrogenase family protein [Acidimicrobiales bacterium]
MTAPRRAVIVGTGLIGASVALALREQGWHVSGVERDAARLQEALDAGVVDAAGPDRSAELVVVAVPVSSVGPVALEALAQSPDATVTDVGSVKAPIASMVADSRFVGGHPMAGSEQDGIKGAHPHLFRGATWVLTPTDQTDPRRFADLRATISSIGADVVELRPEKHDALVALVSHVPHLTAVTLMGIAAAQAEEHATLLRLAAGGFRDMTRIAAGHPAIWPDICAENRDAILVGLDALSASLADVRAAVASGDRSDLLRRLERARAARVNLPARVAQADELCEIRIPVPDRPGVLAEVTTLAGELDVNIVDLEIAHSVEGDRGVLIVTVDAQTSDRVCAALETRGYRPAAQPVAL